MKVTKEVIIVAVVELERNEHAGLMMEVVEVGVDERDLRQ